MKKQRESKQIQLQVVRRFKDGWLCAEAVTLSVLEQLNVEVDPQLIRAASAFNFGMGGTGQEHCGAFTGGLIALGTMLGRHNHGEELSELHREVKSFRLWFLQNHCSLNCRELVDAFGNQRKTECIGLAASTAGYLLSRKSILLHPDTAPTTKRLCVAPGQCPFSGNQ